MNSLSPTRQPLAQASTLPGQLYCRAEVFAAEEAELFSRLWLCVGREEDIASPGDVLTREVAGESLLLTRDEAGAVRAFYNVCRHRGTRLVAESQGARLKCIQCPYHAWTYALDGRLVGAPLMDATPGFDRRDYPLVPVRLESWNGFLFVNLDPEAEPVESCLADFPDLSRFRLAELRRGAEQVYEVAADWKLLCENYGECYHCALVHPQLHRISHYQSGGELVSGACFVGGPMRLNQGFSTMTLSGHSERPPIPGLPTEDHELVHYFNIYPSFLLSPHPDYVLTHTVWPLVAGRSRVVCQWLFTQEAMAATDFDPSDAVEFWDMTNRQDWELCELTQKGVRSRGYRPGRFQEGEACVHAFDNWYLDRMEGRLLGILSSDV